MTDTAHLETPAGPHGDAAHAADVKRHVRVYLAVFGALAALTVVTVAVAYLELPMALAVIVALLIATVKGGLVAGYFMHLLSEQKLISWLVWLTLGLLVVMFFLFLMAYLDQDGLAP